MSTYCLAAGEMIRLSTINPFDFECRVFDTNTTAWQFSSLQESYMSGETLHYHQFTNGYLTSIESYAVGRVVNAIQWVGSSANIDQLRDNVYNMLTSIYLADTMSIYFDPAIRDHEQFKSILEGYLKQVEHTLIIKKKFRSGWLLERVHQKKEYAINNW